MLIQRTVYFREEDIKDWDKISNKAQWLHDNLQGTPHEVHIPNPVKSFDILDEDIRGATLPVIKTVEDVKKVFPEAEWSGAIPKSFSARKKK